MRIGHLTTLLISLSLLFVVACSTGHCRRDGSGQVLKNIDAKLPTGYQQDDIGEIVVYKSDSGLQCGVRPGITLNAMAKKDLAGIKILASEKRSDGLMRIQSCGSSSGMLNTYTIRHRDLLKAQRAGFSFDKNKSKRQD